MAARFLAPTAFQWRIVISLITAWKAAMAEPVALRAMGRQVTGMPVRVGKAQMVMAGRFVPIKPISWLEPHLTAKPCLAEVQVRPAMAITPLRTVLLAGTLMAAAFTTEEQI